MEARHGGIEESLKDIFEASIGFNGKPGSLSYPSFTGWENDSASMSCVLAENEIRTSIRLRPPGFDWWRMVGLVRAESKQN